MKISDTKKGFTIIELIVSFAVFLIVATTVIGIFVYASKAQRKSFESQNVIDNIRFSLEAIAKDIRMGTAFISDTSHLLEFQDFKGSLVDYYRSDSFGNPSPTGEFISKYDTSIGVGKPITADLIKITGLRFNVYNVGADGKQPRVTITIKAQGRNQKPDEKSEIIIQTTLSQRELEF